MSMNNAVLNPEISAITNSKRGRGVKTTSSQFAAMIEWLEMEDNFNWLLGIQTNKTKAGTTGLKLHKKAGYAELANFVNRKCADGKWDLNMTQARLRAYVKRFKATKTATLSQNGAKYAITEQDRANGIITISDKLEHDCPNFKRLDVLFRRLQSTNPPEVKIGGKRTACQLEADEASVKEEDEDDDDDDEKEEEEEVVVENNDESSSDEDSSDDGEEEEEEEVVESDDESSSDEDSSDDESSSNTSSVSALSFGTMQSAKVVEIISKKLKNNEDPSAIFPLLDLVETRAATSGLTAPEMYGFMEEVMKNNTSYRMKEATLALFAAIKSTQAELDRDRFEFEREKFSLMMEAETQRHAIFLQADLKKTIILECIRMDKTPQEIKEYLQVLL